MLRNLQANSKVDNYTELTSLAWFTVQRGQGSILVENEHSCNELFCVLARPAEANCRSTGDNTDWTLIYKLVKISLFTISIPVSPSLVPSLSFTLLCSSRLNTLCAVQMARHVSWNTNHTEFTNCTSIISPLSLLLHVLFSRNVFLLISRKQLRHEHQLGNEIPKVGFHGILKWMETQDDRGGIAETSFPKIQSRDMFGKCLAGLLSVCDFWRLTYKHAKTQELSFKETEIIPSEA